MKLSQDARLRLEADIRRQHTASERTYTDIGASTDIHPSQVSRICRGQFRTLSHNVVRVCRELGVEVETVGLDSPSQDPAVQRLMRSLLEIWNQTPADAKRLTRFLNDLAELRRTSNDG